MTLRPRFSLLTALLIATIVCLSVSHWRTAQRLRSAEAELKSLREYAGVLQVDDKTKVHVIALDPEEPNTWRWRLFLPQGARYGWKLAAGDVPLISPPAQPGAASYSNAYDSDSASEVLVTARLRELDSGEWSLSVASTVVGGRDSLGGASLKFSSDVIAQMRATTSIDQTNLGVRETKILDPGEPIILLMQRHHADPPQEDPDQPQPGYMLWLDPW